MCIPCSWGDLAWLHLWQRFQITGSTSCAFAGFPSSQDHQATLNTFGHTEFLQTLPASRSGHPGTAACHPLWSQDKGSHPISWTPELSTAFEKCKASLSCATLLANPQLISTTGPHHRRLNIHHGSRTVKTCAKFLATPRFLLHEA
jgi:hypothetical protein